MANQVEVPKLIQHVVTGPAADSIAVSKLLMYVVLVPDGSSDAGASTRQGHVHTQIIRRA